MSTLSDTLTNLLKRNDMQTPAPEISQKDSQSSTSYPPAILQSSTSHSPADTENTGSAVLNQSNNDSSIVKFQEKIFSPLRYPERLIIIDDELQLRQYIAEEINLLDDNQLRQKIAVYQKLGVLVRVCESELHKIGIKRNRKFLDDNEEKSYVKLGIAKNDEIKERAVKISAREKWVKRMTGLGLSVAKAESLWLEKEKGKD